MIRPRHADGTFAPLWRVTRRDGSERVIRYVDPLMPDDSSPRWPERWTAHLVVIAVAVALGVLTAMGAR